MLPITRLLVLQALLLSACGEETAEPKDTAAPDPLDSDGDGFSEDVDCDDTDAQVHPDADEICDGVDNDCDGVTDEDDAVDAPTWYLDGDGDGYGGDDTVTACDQPSGYVDAASSGDCDDTAAEINPGADEICGDDTDNDCNGEIDEDTAVDAPTWFEDADGDGYGNQSSPLLSCEQPEGYVAIAGDCDDTAADANPDGTEVCGDGLDNDCLAGDAACGMYGLVTLADITTRLVGVADQDRAGRSVAGAGDVNGDGYDDILVGASSTDSGGVDAGAAYLVLGPLSGSSSLADAQAILQGEAADDAAGVAVSSAGDLNNDGLDDILVGADGQDGSATDAGAAYVLLSPLTGTLSLSSADAILTGGEDGAYAGLALASAGNPNHDGYADILVGAYGSDANGSDSGAVYLVAGPVSASLVLTDCDTLLVGAASNDMAGISVSGPGDVDGDGTDDLLVGAIGDDAGGSNAGAAYLMLGPVSGRHDLSNADGRFTGEASGDQAGRSVSGAGDINADGFPDMVIGANGQDSGAADAGAAYLVLGSTEVGSLGEIDLASVTARICGEAPDDDLGRSVAGVGDVNDDGWGDLLIGAMKEASGGEEAGGAFLFLGPITGEIAAVDADTQYIGEGDFAYTGRSVAAAGDVDHNGYDDMLLGAALAPSADVTPGVAYLLYGGPSE